MINKLTLICLLIIIGTQVNAQEGWVKQKIDGKVTVVFPVPVQKINENSYGIKDKDETVYISTRLDLAKLTNSSVEDFTSNVATQDFADEFLKGMAPHMSNFTFSGVKVGTFKNLPSYYIVGRDSSAKTTIYMNIVFLNGVSYNISCILPDGKSEKTKDLFLRNIMIEK